MSNQSYEDSKILSEYLLFHYGRKEDILSGKFNAELNFIDQSFFFPKRLVTEFKDYHKSETKDSAALDLGCSVGRSSFELSKYYSKVIGIDYSNQFISSAKTLQKKREIDFTSQTEGALTNASLYKLSEEFKPQNITFKQGDASATKSLIEEEGRSQFDFILAANLICRMEEPLKLLNIIPEILSDGGICQITSPYSWLSEYTTKDNWLGGYSKDAVEFRSLDALKNIFLNKLELLEIKEMPFLIREHERKFQFSVSQATVWRKIY